MNITEEGGDLTFTFGSMPEAIFYVELRTNVRGDFGSSFEYADFYWRNSTSNETVFIGQNDGGNGFDCDPNYYEVVFVIPVETYNSWVQEGNGTIPIIFDATSAVNFCNPYAEAYIQFQVDEDCGTFSVAPSSSPSQSQMPTISLEPSVSPSSSPSTEPTISLEPSVTPSSVPSETPTISVEPSVSPSVSPSAEPTISSAPSGEPSVSAAPSTSAAPSQDCPLPRQTTGSASCEGNCGGHAGGCWCDDICLESEDCCTDAYLCEEVGCSAPALRSSAGVYDDKDSSATSYYDIILEPTPDSSAAIPSGAITVSWYKPDGNLLLEWSYPSETTLLYFSEYLAKNVPDGEYKVELKPKSGGQSRSGRVVLVRENGTKPIGGLEDFPTEAEGGDNDGDNGDQ